MHLIYQIRITHTANVSISALPQMVKIKACFISILKIQIDHFTAVCLLVVYAIPQNTIIKIWSHCLRIFMYGLNLWSFCCQFCAAVRCPIKFCHTLGFPFSREEEKEEQNIQLPHLHRPNWPITRWRELYWQTEVYLKMSHCVMWFIR